MSGGRYIEISLLTYVEEGVTEDEASDILLDVCYLIDRELNSDTVGTIDIKTEEEVDNANKITK